jgi:aminoglycoside 2'-N-acetyltransferase I
MRVRLRERGSFSAAELDDLRVWLEAAYDDGPWRSAHRDEIGPGPHVVAEDDDGSLLGHACVAWVPITIGDTVLRAGYLEDVATRADVRGRGIGAAVVTATHSLIRDDAQLGFLATGSQPFYERIGWVRWRGPLERVRARRHADADPRGGRLPDGVDVPRDPAAVARSPDRPPQARPGRSVVMPA